MGARIQTINAWGYALVARWLGRRPELLDERDARRLIEDLVPRQRRRVNTDPIARYIEGLSLVRLGLRDPQAVEDEMGDVPGLAAAVEPYRAALRDRGVIDFDEQVFLALEVLLADGELRRTLQAEHRHLLVDELQDLTPAHVLLVRLLSCPGFDVFGVGDDDQTIYGHAGADPRFLVEYDHFFPAAGSHALEVNYRCPAPVTGGSDTALLQPAQGRQDHPSGPRRCHRPCCAATSRSILAMAAHAPWLRGRFLGWRADVEPGHVAVLTRVHSLLLAPHVALTAADIPVDSVLDEGVLARLGVRAALAYLRIAVEPGMVDPQDFLEVHRRPSRGLPNWAEKWLGRCHSIVDVRRAATRLDDAKVAAKLSDLADDLERLTALAASGASTRELLTAVRDAIGLGSAMTLLDSTGGAAGSHLDDLEALLQVADLQTRRERLRGLAATLVPPPPRARRCVPVDDPPSQGP